MTNLTTEQLEAELAYAKNIAKDRWDVIQKMEQRIEELEAEKDLCRCADAVRCEMRKLITDCEPYLKEGETPAECIQRNRDDVGAALKLLAKEKRKYEALVGWCKEYAKRNRVFANELRALLEDDDVAS